MRKKDPSKPSGMRLKLAAPKRLQSLTPMKAELKKRNRPKRTGLKMRLVLPKRVHDNGIFESGQCHEEAMND